MEKLKLEKTDNWTLKDSSGKKINGYEGLWESCGLEIVNLESLGSYQGDIVCVLKDPATGLFAYATTGYGSCSGCDAYEACKAVEDYEDLRDSITSGLVWKNGPELAAWLEKHDWKGDYIGQGSDNDDFQKWLSYSVATLKVSK